MNYAIIDVETTGNSPSVGKITEIAIFIHNGFETIDSFVTLVNPECKIPWNITRLTGINDEMVQSAPKFYEIAKKIVELTANTTFVAHNVAFDYSFVREEFKKLGYDYKRKTLCTVTLSRKIIPGLRSYSLGNLCQELNIPINNRHRAGGDALATVALFEKILRQNETAEVDLFTTRKGNLTEEAIAKIPGKCGVYYFYDQAGTLIYIGKSKNIHQRVTAHLNNRLTKKAMEMADRIHSVDFDLTNNELTALLQESAEIKANKPFYNRSQRRAATGFGIFSYEDNDGFLNLRMEKVKEDDLPLTTFTFQQEGINKLQNLVDKYSLCPKLCHLENNENSCFNSKIGKCYGACMGYEEQESYNVRVLEAIKEWQFPSPNFFILEQTDTKDRLAVVKINNNNFVGFGYTTIETTALEMDELHDSIRKYQDNYDARNIIKGYLRKNYRRLRIIPY